MKLKIKQLLILFVVAILLIACKKEEKEKTMSCKILIECSTILDNLDLLSDDKKEMLPEGGVILSETEVEFVQGENVFDVLQRVCKEQKILMESSFTPGTNSAYIEGIANLYEFDCGSLSGWQFTVNDEYVGTSCSEYEMNDGDVIAFRYTCNMGEDLK